MIKYGLDTEKTYTNNKGFNYNIVTINSAINVIIEFESGYICKTSAHKILHCSPKDRLSPSVHGVGINDLKCNKDEYYTRWLNMLKRCYSKSSLKELPTYNGVTVCDEWLYLSNFKKWMEKQDWKGKELDKDILKVGNKVYCPEYCVFVDREINTLLGDCRGKRGNYPQGVSKNKKRFKAQYQKIDKGIIHIGTYDTPEEAYYNYCIHKSAYIKEIADKQPLNIKLGLYRHADVFDNDANTFLKC